MFAYLVSAINYRKRPPVPSVRLDWTAIGEYRGRRRKDARPKEAATAGAKLTKIRTFAACWFSSVARGGSGGRHHAIPIRPFTGTTQEFEPANNAVG
jgi:hypothetical protein